MGLSILADRVFDGERLLNGAVEIAIENGFISSIEAGFKPASGRRRAAAPGDVVLDARGATVLPGLINTHVHIVRGGMFKADELLSVPQIAVNFRSCLMAGTTTAADMGCAAGLIGALRDHTAAHPGHGPSIVCGGPLLTCPKGYPLDWMPWFAARMGAALACRDKREARKNVRLVAKTGMDFIKLAVMHRSYADRPMEHVSQEVAGAVVAEAHALGLRVMVHAHYLADYDVALKAGVDALMHSCFEPLDPDMAARVRDAGICVCPTLWVFEAALQGAEQGWHDDPRYYSLVNKRIRREWKAFSGAFRASGDVVPEGTVAAGLSKARGREAIANTFANVLLLHQAGVPLALGNDSAYGFSLPGRPADEIRAMARAGLSPIECLRAATKNAATLLNLHDRGVLAPGKRADILIVRGDPSKDLAALEQVGHVIHAGRIVEAESPADKAKRTARVSAAILAGVSRTIRYSLQGS